MKILVTGATGSVGREVVALLVRGGHEVRVVGRRAGMELPGADYRACDITDFAVLKEAMRGTERVLHLAAIASPLGAPDEEVFRVNCDGTFKVYQAAAELGIRRVVSASSINAFGFNYGIKRFAIRYLPIDEAHPTFTTDSYSFSKQVLEETAEYFWRREGISGCCLRLPWVANATPEVLAHVRRNVAENVPLLEEWLRLPPEQARARAAEVVAAKERSRAGRMEEHPYDHARFRSLPFAATGLLGCYTNFFTQLDARDSAQAFAKALFGSYEGSHPLFVNDSLNCYLLDARGLAGLFYPEAEARPALRGPASLVSIERARRLIGFEPEHTIDRIGVHPAR